MKAGWPIYGMADHDGAVAVAEAVATVTATLP
ncbi:hypothetical protein CRE_31536 [Caenorhabditis remanei]|uniref:Uncharacterized protein n=1 Tax=Caenorhabditis remanei TaxID=31234 RepID=E3NGH9_CAERE|nr:hypothetical protein CRE_31536 [Caenorhabditis remanei]